jgi:hypothetical protein
MSSKSARRYGSLAGRGRRLRVAGLVAVVAAALVALTPLSAQAQPQPGGAMVFTHSANGGELKGGRLTLRGVGRRVTWVHQAGRSGTVSVRRLHRTMFAPDKPATGTLHVAGHRGGDEPTFRLSDPRYNPARRTVSYRARPLNNKPLPSRAARAAGLAGGGKFSAASLTIVPAAQGGTNSCLTGVINNTGSYLSLAQQDLGHGTWLGSPPGSIQSSTQVSWNAGVGSDGTCSSSVVYQFGGGWTYTITQTGNKNDSDGFSYTCESNAPHYECRLNGADPRLGLVSWTLEWVN